MMAANLKHLRIGLTNWEQKGNYQFTQENIGNMPTWATGNIIFKLIVLKKLNCIFPVYKGDSYFHEV